MSSPRSPAAGSCRLECLSVLRTLEDGMPCQFCHQCTCGAFVATPGACVVQANIILQEQACSQGASQHVTPLKAQSLLSRASSRSASPFRAPVSMCVHPLPGHQEQPPRALTDSIDAARRLHSRLRRASREPPADRSHHFGDGFRPGLTLTDVAPPYRRHSSYGSAEAVQHPSGELSTHQVLFACAHSVIGSA
jgi:hypothetical protein